MSLYGTGEKQYNLTMNIINGNSLKIPLVNESVQMVITSPPYWNARDYSNWPTYTDYLSDMEKVWGESYRVLCDSGRIAVNVPDVYGRPNFPGGCQHMAGDTIKSLLNCGFSFRGNIVWNQPNSSSKTSWGSWMSASDPGLCDYHEMIIVCHKGGSNRGKGVSTITKDDFMTSVKSVWDIRPETSSWHSAPFPPEIPRRLIELYTFLGDIVLDPFSGSGTTPKVADKLGRIGIGIELKMDYAAHSVLETLSDFEKFGRLQNISKQDGGIKDLPLFS